MKQPAARDLTDQTEMTAQGTDLDAPIPYRVAQFHGDARPVLEMLTAIKSAKSLLNQALTFNGPMRGGYIRSALRILSNIASE